MDAQTVLHLPKDLQKDVLADHDIMVEETSDGTIFLPMSPNVSTRSQSSPAKGKPGGILVQHLAFPSNVAV